MKTNYVLIDFENVQVKSLALLKDESFRVYVFLGPNNSKLPVDLVIAMQRMGARADYITLETPGNNALDFHIAYYLGVLSKTDAEGAFHIISRDSGFDPLIQHLKGKRIQAARSVSIEALPCLAGVPSPVPMPRTALPGRTPPPAPPRPPARPVHPALPVRPLPSVHPAPPKEAKLPVTAVPPDLVVKAALDDLVKRKASRPRTVKTLLSTIHAKCGKELSEAQVQAVCQALVKRGYVKLEGTRVTYSLPQE